MKTKMYGLLSPCASRPKFRGPWARGIEGAKHRVVTMFKALRDNGLPRDAPAGSEDIPRDGKYTWVKGEVREGCIYGVEKKDGTYEYELRYDAGPGDLAWYEQKDRNYLTRILREGRLRECEPAVWYMRGEDQAQDTDIGEWWSQKLKLPNINALLNQAEKPKQGLQALRTPQPPAAGGSGDALGDNAPALASGRAAEAGMFRAPTRFPLGLPEARTQALGQFKDALSGNDLDSGIFKVDTCGDKEVEISFSSDAQAQDDILLSKLSACLERMLGSTVIRKARISDGVFSLKTSNKMQRQNLLRFLQESGMRLVTALAPSEAGSASPRLAAGQPEE